MWQIRASIFSRKLFNHNVSLNYPPITRKTIHTTISNIHKINKTASNAEQKKKKKNYTLIS